LKLSIATMLTSSALCAAQDLKFGLTYVCSGERLYVERCDDASDDSKCLVGHPDHTTPTGFPTYTTLTRAALKKLFPTCQQPTAADIARAENVRKLKEQMYDADGKPRVKAAAPAPVNPVQRVPSNPALAGIRPPKNAEERALRRCVSSGRLPATCTGNSLLGAFGQMIAQALPLDTKAPPPGPELIGAYEGAGNWRLDFQEGGVVVNCSMLHPEAHGYTLAIRNNRAVLTVESTPSPIVLTVRADATLAGAGPIQVDGPVASGSSRSSASSAPEYQYRDANGNRITNLNASTSAGPVFDSSGNKVYGQIDPGSSAPQTNYVTRRATCVAPSLSSKGAVGAQQLQTDFLKSVFSDGDKGPGTPPGVRMQGIYAASTGFSVQFFPESVILGCGPDSARAYPYTVIADGNSAVIKVAAPDHPLTLAFRPDGSLDAGAGPYQVHGRIGTGQDNNGDFTFAPMEQSCNLSVLMPSKEIPPGVSAMQR
jgi:hypothetical protein